MPAFSWPHAAVRAGLPPLALPCVLSWVPSLDDYPQLGPASDGEEQGGDPGRPPGGADPPGAGQQGPDGRVPCSRGSSGRGPPSVGRRRAGAWDGGDAAPDLHGSTRTWRPAHMGRGSGSSGSGSDWGEGGRAGEEPAGSSSDMDGSRCGDAPLTPPRWRSSRAGSMAGGSSGGLRPRPSLRASGSTAAGGSAQLLAHAGCPLHAVDIVSEGCIAVGGHDSLASVCVPKLKTCFARPCSHTPAPPGMHPLQVRIYTVDRHHARELRKSARRRRVDIM